LVNVGMDGEEIDFFTKKGSDELEYTDGTKEPLETAYKRIKNARNGAAAASKNFRVKVSGVVSYYQLIWQGGIVTQISHDGARARYVRRINHAGELSLEELRGLFADARRSNGDPYEYSKLAPALHAALDSERATIESVREAGSTAARWTPLFFAEFANEYPQYHGLLRDWQVEKFVTKNPAYYELLPAHANTPYTDHGLAVELVDIEGSSKSESVHMRGANVLVYNDGTSEPLQSAYLRLEMYGGATKNFKVKIGSATSWYQLVSSGPVVLQLSHDGMRRRHVVRVVHNPLSTEELRRLIINVEVKSGGGTKSNEKFVKWMTQLHAALRDGRTNVFSVRENIYTREYEGSYNYLGGRWLEGFLKGFVKEHPEYHMLLERPDGTQST
jgi:hypothetical protein